MIHPIQSRLLIELRGNYKNFSATEERFGTSKTQGVVVAMSHAVKNKIAKDPDLKGLNEGSTVYFGKYEDTAPYTIDGKDYALIELKEIGGWSDADA